MKRNNGHRLDKTEHLASLIQSCFEKGGVHLIEVPADYSANDRILNYEIQERSKALL